MQQLENKTKKGQLWESVSISYSNGKYLHQFCFGVLTVEVRGKKPQNCPATLTKIQDTLVGIRNFPSLEISLNVTGKSLNTWSFYYSQVIFTVGNLLVRHRSPTL